MTNDVIFSMQLISLATFVGTAFWLYHLLVKQKDGIIEQKNGVIEQKNGVIEQKDGLIETLRSDARSLERTVNDLANASPDALVSTLDRRVRIVMEEMKRLEEADEKNQDEIAEKALELSALHAKLTDLTRFLDDAGLVCPSCGAPIEQRYAIPMSAEHNGREVDWDIEILQYECGYTVHDGAESVPCGGGWSR